MQKEPVVYPKLITDFIEVQSKYPTAVVLTEVGGFFEIWQLDDLNLGHAIRASQILDIALTRRDKSKLDSPRMAGFPSYTVENYIKKLVDAGETVVVVKQEINGKKSDNNKQVKRYVDRIVSPGTSIHSALDNKPNYFGCCYEENGFVGICLIDVSTGEVRISETGLENAKIFMENNDPIEILFCSDEFLHKKDKQIFHKAKNVITRQSSAGVVLGKVYDEENPSSNHSVVLSKIGIDLWPLGSLALANLLNFLTEYNPLLLKKISKPEVDRPDNHMFMSKNAYLSLDIFESPIEKDEHKTLFGSLNSCKTAMGRRALRKWIQHPLVNKKEIEKRLDTVASLIEKNAYMDELKEVFDISRLTRRMALKTLMAHEIVSFHTSLVVSNKVLDKVKRSNKEIKKVCKFINSNLDLDKLEKEGINDYCFYKGSIEDKVILEKQEWLDTNALLNKRTGELAKLLDTDKLRIAERQESIQLVGPKSLHHKCKDEGVEVKIKASEVQILDKKWDELASKEFYLKRKYTLACEKAWDVFQSDVCEKFSEILMDFSNEVGEIDVLSAFAKISKDRNYSRPNFVESKKAFVDFKKMRHPVVELSKDHSESFVANDLKLDIENNIMVIYGANSAGKSTILKSLALNIIMAQIGCFIPANKDSKLTIFDSIMTRMTTYDSLSEGLSTFTMEMIELQNALKRFDEKSLFLFDEIGRGTSVEDGEAIAFATLDYLRSKETSAITLFSTHYHTLYENIKDFKNISVKHMDGKIRNNLLSFSRLLQDGPGEGSYGIMVAKSCGMPEEIVRLAENYRTTHNKLVVSRYNKSIQGTLCEFCHENPAQETHHLIEQHQGKVEKITINGVEKGIHDQGNLVLLCATCHRKITHDKIVIKKTRVVGQGSKNFILEIIEKDK